MKKPTISANISKQETRKLAVHTLGLMKYDEATALQSDMHDKRMREQIPDTLLLLSHPNVISIGKRGDASDILAPAHVLRQNEVSVVQSSRGGQVTIHTPGQLIGYFIFHLYHKQRAVREFVYMIEQVIMDTLASFLISARHDEKHTGVWVEHKKIASIGISVSGGVTQHGFALNVCNKLKAFRWIVPCGMPQIQVTSMVELCTTLPPMGEVCDAIVQSLTMQRHYCDIIKHTSKPEW